MGKKLAALGKNKRQENIYPAPDTSRMQKAISDFLQAAGLELDDPQLKDTPSRVTEAWVHEFLDGYQKTPGVALGETFPLSGPPSENMVVMSHIRFHSTCPHHLLPWSGVAHLAYIPRRKVVGFGRMVDLLNCYAHRLILQEDLAQKVARTMFDVLESPATACVIEAEQACLQVRGACQYDAVTHSEAYEGKLKTDAGLRAQLWARIGTKK